jgi:hypothetical protein
MAKWIKKKYIAKRTVSEEIYKSRIFTGIVANFLLGRIPFPINFEICLNVGYFIFLLCGPDSKICKPLIV